MAVARYKAEQLCDQQRDEAALNMFMIVLGENVHLEVREYKATLPEFYSATEIPTPFISWAVSVRYNLFIWL